MDESIFFSFINSVSSTFGGAQSYNPPYHRQSDEYHSRHQASYDDRDVSRSRSRRHRSPPSSTLDFSHSGRSTHGRPHSSSLTSGLGRASQRLTTQVTHQSDSALTDDSGSASSPGKEPMTPPTTPPSSDMGRSPKQANDNTWKKMGQKLGWKKKSSGGLRPMEEE